MLRPIEFAIASRYLRSRNKNRFVSFISLTSVIGIALAVAVLITVLSAMNGFENEVRQRILSVLGHATITGIDGPIMNWAQLQDTARQNAGLRASAPFVSGEAMLVGRSEVKGVEVRGIDPVQELATSALAGLLKAGSFDCLVAGSYQAIIGSELAERIKLKLGDDFVLLAAEGITTPAGVMPRMRHFRVCGIFYAGMYEYDQGLVFANISDVGHVLRTGSGVTGVRLSFFNPNDAPLRVRDIAQAFGGGVYVTDWTREHVNFFRSIEITKSIMFVILLLVVAVAAFNIISTLVMVVREKRGEIAILRTLGAAPRGVMGIFMLQGTLIGVVGTTLGVVLGAAISLNLAYIVRALERALDMRFLAPDVYFISDFPTQLLWTDVVLIGSVALCLAVAATIYPAWRGSLAPPAEALRNS
jgi:lipoprotein-releasing system permease protein